MENKEYVYVLVKEETIDFETQTTASYYRSLQGAKEAMSKEIDNLKKECAGGYDTEEIRDMNASFNKGDYISIELRIEKEVLLP